jgi:bifunctional isochorismate lyase/aryl carrier protein
MATFHADVEDYDVGNLVDAAGGPGWLLAPTRATVLVHDMLPYYLQVLPRPVSERTGAAVDTAVEWARGLGLPLLASAPRPAEHLAQRGLGGRLWGKGPSVEQVKQTAVHGFDDPGPTTVRKRSYSAFYATDLEVELRRSGRDQLIVIGVFASGGVLATAFDALARDLELFVVAEATADYTPQRHRSALDLISGGIGQVITLDELPGIRESSC